LYELATRRHGPKATLWSVLGLPAPAICDTLRTLLPLTAIDHWSNIHGMNSSIYTDSQLHELLSHPDAYIRSLADWTREYRGMGTRRVDRDLATADQFERRLGKRLWDLNRAGLDSSPAYTIDGTEGLDP
jgi:hypothetical protein